MATTAAKTTDTALDRRRAKWLATAQSAAEAESALAELDDDLEATALRREASKLELEAAGKRAASLEKEIKTLAKQRERLRRDRTRAKRDMKKSRSRAKVAEKKFDKALLADILRQARSADLAKANGTPRQRATSTTRRRTGQAAATTRRTVATNGRSAPM